MTKTKTYTVSPINTVENINKHFDWVYSWITPEHCPLKPSTGKKEIELIQIGNCSSTEDAIKKMDELGYEPAPSPYLLGLGVQYPEVIKEKEYIVSLDEENVLPREDGDPCFLDLYWLGERDLRLAERAGEWDGYWWFAVIRKSLNTSESPKNLDTETLESAIQLCKEAGLVVYKPL